MTGRSDSNKWQHSEPRLRSARGQARGRDEDPGRGHPVLAGPAHQLLKPGQAYTPDILILTHSLAIRLLTGDCPQR